MKYALFLSLFVALIVKNNAGTDDDDFVPTKYSPNADVELAHKYPHLSTSFKEQDNTFMSNEESPESYALSLVVFPAMVAGICFICVCCFFLVICTRCCFLGCLNCFKFCFRLCIKDCCRHSKEKKESIAKNREKYYAIYSNTFPCLLLCSMVAIIWVWVGSHHLDNGVTETQHSMTKFGNIVESISNELSAMSESGKSIDNFLAFNTCPPTVSSYLEDIGEAFSEFTNSTASAAKITASVQPAVDKASKNLENYWEDIQEVAFDMSAALLFLVICIYTLGMFMKTAILMRLGLLLTIILSFVLCILVFVEMVLVMGFSDFCMSPTYHIERSLDGSAFDVVHYYTTCEGQGPLYKPVQDSLLYNSMMNSTYLQMITDNPLLSASCRIGAASMEQSFIDIADGVVNVVEFARCPYIHEIYAHLMLEGFCSESYSGFYNIHVSHLATLTIFFMLMVNASLLYPHYKGKTLKHMCWCFYSKEDLQSADENHRYSKTHSHLFTDINDSPSLDSDSEDEEMGGGAAVSMSSIPTIDPDKAQVEMVRIPDYKEDVSCDLSYGAEDDHKGEFSFVNPSFTAGGGGVQGHSLVRVQAEDTGQLLGASDTY